MRYYNDHIEFGLYKRTEMTEEDNEFFDIVGTNTAKRACRFADDDIIKCYGNVIGLGAGSGQVLVCRAHRKAMDGRGVSGKCRPPDERGRIPLNVWWE
jgi:hypothetical protein